MKKLMLILILCFALFIFTTGCNNTDYIPTYEEISAMNQYQEIFKIHSNIAVTKVQKSDIPEENITEEIIFLPGNGKIDYHLRTKQNSQDSYYEHASRLGNYWYYSSITDGTYAVLELGEIFLLDYTISDLFDGIPVGKPYIEDNYIVYHAYRINPGYEEIKATRDDFIFYFNLETKLIEKITGKLYNENHEVVTTSEAIFAYSVKEYFTPTLYDTIHNDEKKIKVEIILDYNTPEQKSYEFVTIPSALNIVYVDYSSYDLYTDSEYQNQVLTLEEISDVTNLKLYAKKVEYSE